MHLWGGGGGPPLDLQGWHGSAFSSKAFEDTTALVGGGDGVCVRDMDGVTAVRWWL